MAETKAFWNVELVKKEDLRTDINNMVSEAKKVIDAATPETLLILSTSNQSPEKIVKAAIYSQENLAEIVKFNEAMQAQIK